MKYIKSFEARGKFGISTMYIAEEETKVKNYLARRLEYNINKFFNRKRKNAFYTNVHYYKRNEEERPIITFFIDSGYDDSNKDRIKVFKDEINRLDIDNFMSYDLTIEQAEQLLISIKEKLPRNLIELDAKKYNL